MFYEIFKQSCPHLKFTNFAHSLVVALFFFSWNFANFEVMGEVSAPLDLFPFKSCISGLTNDHPRRLMMTAVAAVMLAPATWLFAPLWGEDVYFDKYGLEYSACS